MKCSTCSLGLVIVAAVLVTTASMAEINAGPTNSVSIWNRSPYDMEVYRNDVPWEDQGKPSAGKQFHFPAQVGAGATITFTNVATTKAEKITILLQVKETHNVGCIVYSRVAAVCTRTITVGANNAPQVITVSTNDFTSTRKHK